MKYDQFPVDIDSTYVPMVGDKIERTNRITGTVLVGTIDKLERTNRINRLVGMAETYIALDAGDVILYSYYFRYSDPELYSFRLLYRPPIRNVGDKVIPGVANSWYPGTILQNGSTTRVVLSHPVTGVHHYRDVKTLRVHERLNTEHIILFLPSEKE